MRIDTRVRSLDLLTRDGSPPLPAPGDVRARQVLRVVGIEPSAGSSRGSMLSVLSADADGTESSMYTAWPSLEDPVLIASVRDPSDRLVWFGTTSRRRLVRYALRVGATGERFRISGELPAVARKWSELTGHGAAGVSISNGTAGANRRPVAVILDRNGEAIAFARCASSTAEVDALKQEAALIVTLRERSALRESVPAVLEPVLVGGHVVMYMRGRRGMARGPRSLDHRHVEFARALSSVESNVSHVLECSAVRNAHQTMSLAGLDDSDRRVGEWLLDSLSTVSLITCRQHRDFVPWNTAITREVVLYVYDWEYSQAGHTMAHDLMHFVCMPLVLNGVTPGRVRALAYKAWRLSCAEDAVDFETCFLLWVLDLWALYASAWSRNPVGSRSVLDWVATFAAVQRGLR